MPQEFSGLNLGFMYCGAHGPEIQEVVCCVACNNLVGTSHIACRAQGPGGHSEAKILQQDLSSFIQGSGRGRGMAGVTLAPENRAVVCFVDKMVWLNRHQSCSCLRDDAIRNGCPVNPSGYLQTGYMFPVLLCGDRGLSSE
jgi:hypothetical protein